MNWKPVYGLLLLFATCITWFSGIYIEKQKNSRLRNFFLTMTVVVILLILFLFKYAGFTSEIVNSFFELIHIRMSLPSLPFLLPIGISFYTFQVIAYIVDVYRGKISAERNFLTYALFISFFPQLVAGPIERAVNLLPQFRRPNRFNDLQFIEGIKTMVWGYFMKLCIADRIAPYVDAIFDNYRMHNGTSLLLGAFFFTFQIYCDFAGYSLIALGVSKCLNFSLMQNFKRPFLASNVQVFWKRWHVSLSTWFMDYLYIPLGGNRCSLPRNLFNLFITFIISGLWHGAKGTFLLWGALHGIFILVFKLQQKQLMFLRIKFRFPLRTMLNICFTFTLTMFAFIFFRANNVGSSFIILKKIFTEPGTLYKGNGIPNIFLALFCIALLMFKEIKDETGLNIHFIHNKNIAVSIVSSALMISFILLTAEFSGEAFIYFQF